MTLRQILEAISSEYLYHATYKQLIPSIKKQGLNPNISKKSWSFSGNYVYLSPDKDVAESYAETSDNVPEEYLDQIVVFRIKVSSLDTNKLSIDNNNKARDTYQYTEIIPWNLLNIVK